MRAIPETTVDPNLRRELDSLGREFESIEDAERRALTADIAHSLRPLKLWLEFCDIVSTAIAASGFIIVRGLEPDEGRSLLIVSCALGGVFDSYKPGRVVKHFRMSPWTDALSHTIKAGDFHTDGNVATVPPSSTALQCAVEDPGAPEYAEQRVAFLPDLLVRLAGGDEGDVAALAFLTQAQASMAQEHSAQVWRGRLVDGDTVRYHPVSLRLGCRRLGEQIPELEAMIASVHRAAIDVSVPFHTSPGDTVLVSNRKALHYRGACSVRFTRFPSEFESRSLFVLHKKESGG